MLNIANNHSRDCGEESYKNSFNIIEKSGLEYFGNETILKKEIRWIKVAFVGVNDFDKNISYPSILSTILKLKNDGYKIVVNVHFWDEYQAKHSQRQEQISYNLIDVWANIIIGHHPHVSEDIEYYHWIPIIYSLGNFLFDQSQPNTLSGAWVLFAIWKQGTNIEIINFKRDPNNYSIHF